MQRFKPAILTYHNALIETQTRLEQDVTTIGRSISCSIVIALPTVSRLHAVIELQHDRYVLLDADSANGTFINGKRIHQPRQLRTGDSIWLGSPDPPLTFFDPEETVAVQLEASTSQIYIDEFARSVHVYGLPVALSPLEYRLLRHLATEAGTVCTRESCFQAAWDQPYDHATCEDALNACVTKLRRNLRTTATIAGHPLSPIVTLPRIGFRLDADVVFAADRPTRISPQDDLPLSQQALSVNKNTET